MEEIRYISRKLANIALNAGYLPLGGTHRTPETGWSIKKA